MVPPVVLGSMPMHGLLGQLASIWIHGLLEHIHDKLECVPHMFLVLDNSLYITAILVVVGHFQSVYIYQALDGSPERHRYFVSLGMPTCILIN